MTEDLCDLFFAVGPSLYAAAPAPADKQPPTPQTAAADDNLSVTGFQDWRRIMLKATQDLLHRAIQRKEYSFSTYTTERGLEYYRQHYTALGYKVTSQGPTRTTPYLTMTVSWGLLA